MDLVVGMHGIPFKRKLSKGSYGSDVEAVGRALCAAKVFLPLSVFNLFPKKIKRMYGRRKIKAVKKFQTRHRIKPADGVYRKSTHDKLTPYFDKYGKVLYKNFEPPPPKVKIVPPRQGFNSLDKSLWEAYSIGRNLGMSDLGTYNPASRLPSGAPSDHAVYPARAFDLGISPAIGYSNPIARKYFNLIIQRPEIEYAILGDKIWSRGRGLHQYYSGGHNNHIHVSGRR